MVPDSKIDKGCCKQTYLRGLKLHPKTSEMTGGADKNLSYYVLENHAHDINKVLHIFIS